MTKTTFSIVSGGSRENLDICLQSLRRAVEGLDCALVVTDNAADWDVESTVKTIFPDAEIIKNSVPKGFGANHNAALLGRNDKYAVVANDDLEVAPDAVSELLKAAEQRERGAIFGPLLYPGSWEASPIAAGGKLNERVPKPLLTSISLIMRLFLGNAAIASMLVRRNKGRQPTDERKGYVSGAFCLIKRGYIEEHGLFDPKFYMYYDDIDLGRRARDAGFECWQVATAKVTHKEGGSFSPRTWRWIADSTLRYSRKYHGLVVTTTTRALLAILKCLLWFKPS